MQLLLFLQAIELELDAYSGLINELCSQGQKMIEQNHPESKAIEQRKEHLQQTMKNVQKLATMRRQRLVESMNRHDYLREVDSLKAWIVEQMVTATSEDFGQDYEHLLVSFLHDFVSSNFVTVKSLKFTI